MKKIVLVLLFSVVFLQIRSQDIQEIQLKHWSSKLGLSSDEITSFTQDYKGFLWIGTSEGLNRFDGLSFLTIPLKREGIDLGVKELFSYKQGIYVFTGVESLFQIDLDDFSQRPIIIDNLKDDELKKIILEFQGSKSEVYNGDRFKLTKKGDLFVNGSKINGVFHNLYMDSRHRLWISSVNKGIGYWDSFNGTISYILTATELASLDLKNVYLFRNSKTPKVIMTEGVNERVWFYQNRTANVGFWDYELNKGYTIKNIKTHPYLKDANSLLSVLIDVEIETMFFDKVGNLWIGTVSNGMFRVRFKEQSFQHYEFDYGSKTGLARSDISCPTPLNNGNVWIGTWGGGINILKKEDLKLSSPKFKIISPQTGLIGTLYDGQVFPIFEDSKENIWVGTINAGLHFLSKEFRTKRTPFFVNYNKEKGEVISDSIMNIYEDSKAVIWIATAGGLTRYLPNKKVFESEFVELENPTIFKDVYILTVFEDSMNNLWISTKNNGLFRWNRNTNQVSHLDTFENFSTNFILNIVEEPKKSIWLSGVNGLFLYNLSSNKFEYKVDAEKLSTNHIESMILGTDGLLWLGTNRGLYTYNPSTKRVTHINLPIGVYINSFTRGVSKDTNGYLYFGTRKGFYRFHPDKLVPKSLKVPVFTDLKIDGESYRNRDKLMGFDISTLSKVSLNYEENTFSIHYNNLNYYVEDQVFYETSMTLKGEKENWTTTYDTSKSWVKLKEGNYVFKVRNNNDSIISKINIQISPPWWRTKIAFAGYIIFVLLGTYFLIQVFTKKAITKAKKSQDEKFDKMRFKFFLNIAHEIRTPLTLIKGGLERLKDEGGISSKGSKELSRAHRNTERLSRLVNEVLDLKKIERTEIDLNLKTVNLKWFLENVIDVFKFRENEISLTFNAPKEPIWITSDKQLLESIVYNLISNAIKYSKADAKIEVSLFKPSDNEISIQVKDNGFGIKKEEQQLIFERLYQSDEHLKTGTGIGLAIVKQYVDLLNGSIDLKSELNMGSVFTVTFPHKTADFEQKTTEENDNLIISKNKFGATLLIIDDQKELRTFIKEIFEDEYNIIEASNGEEGLKLAKQQQPSLIISDVMMPVMNGVELCRKIRNDITVSHIPIILLTAKTGEEAEVEGISSGADGYINKPFSQKILKSRVNVLIENRKKLIKKYGVSIDEDLKVLASNDLDRAFLERFEKILSEQYSHSDLSVEELASEMAVSVSGFYTKIKSITGLSPVEFVRTYRLKRAAQLLKSTNISVTEVSEISGFGTQKYFSNSFKKHFGISPLAYRKE